MVFEFLLFSLSIFFITIVSAIYISHQINIFNNGKQKELDMNTIARHITVLEGKKKSINIAQVKEVLKIINNQTDGSFYPFLKNKYKLNRKIEQYKNTHDKI